MDEQNTTSPSQPPRKNRTASQVERDRRQRAEEREARLAEMRAEKTRRREFRQRQFKKDGAKFWQGYFDSRPRGARQQLALELGIDPSNFTLWQGGAGWSAENASLLLDHRPSVFTDDQRSELISLSLRSCGFSDPSVEAITSLSESSSPPVRELRRQEVEWFSTVISDAAIEIIRALTTPPPSDDPVDPRADAAYSVMNRICAYYDNRYEAKQAVRACIFLPMESDPTRIEIKWNKWVDDESKRWNRWYIGDDPVPPNRKRGLAGRTWRAGAGKTFPRHVFDDPDFEDQRQPPRPKEEIRYSSLVQTPILGRGQKVIGLLSVDSLVHEFNALDLAFMNRAMLLLVPFLDTADPA